MRNTNGNKYVLAIDQYSKWCETRSVKEHDAYTATKFMEDEVICKYGVLKYVLTDNGSKWMKEFAEIYQNYSITHQFTAPAWLQCNGMVEHLIKTIKHGLTLWLLPTYRIGIYSYQEYFLDTNVASKPTQNIPLSWCSLVVHQDSPLITTLVVCVMCLMNRKILKSWQNK